MSVMDLLEDAWDGVCDPLDYMMSFEWVGDIGDFFSGLFSGLNEFSFMGLVFAILVIILIYVLSPKMLKPFLSHMGKFEGMFWGLMTYIGSGVMGYLVGKRLFD